MKQKILVLFIVFIFTVVPLTAKKIDALAAEKAGMIHLEQQQHIWLSQLNQGLLQQEVNNFSITNVSPVIDETSGDTLFYVLHLSPGGFIVVSGDTVIQPVIAYSYNGDFSLADVSGNLLLQMLKKDIRERLSAASPGVNNREWGTLLDGIAMAADFYKNIEQWPPVGHSQYNKGWLNTDVTAPVLEQIVSYWKSPVPLEAPPDTMDIAGKLTETWQYNSAKKEKYFDSTSFFTGLIDNMRKGWPVQLAVQIENSSEMRFVICDGYRKTGSGAEYFHLEAGGEWGAWYALKDSGHFIKYGVMDIHPTADLHEPNKNRHDAFPIMETDFVGKAGVWDSSPGTKIKPSQERDWYRFEAEAGEKVTINFRGNWTEAAGEIALYNNDILLKQQEIIGNGESESFSHRADTAGTYYIAIGNKSDKPGEGDISREDPEEAVANAEQPYGISVVKIIDDDDPPNLLTVELIEPYAYTVDENSYVSFSAEAYFDDDTTANVTNTAAWSENSSYAWFSSSTRGRLYTNNVPSDQTVNITVSYTYNGRTRYAYHTVTVKQSPMSYITIIGPSTVMECTDNYYTIRAYFSDGTYTTPSTAVSWSIVYNSNYAEINSGGKLEAGAVCCPTQIIIKATYTTGGINGTTKSAYKTVTILDD